ncbi:MAG: hypothetical protein IK143_07555 [Bacteroidales bacterium]|nr:hypothetical protein [Bacteroidales bacterium]
MKKIVICAVAAAMAFSLGAQDAPEQFKQKYDLLVSRLGVDGVGVETHISKWESAYPEDLEMLQAKFLYYLAKSQSSQIVCLPDAKFLGQEPMLALKDSTGAPMNYFQEPMYEDSLFMKADLAIDKAARLAPEQLDFKFARANALMGYEKGSPDMTLAYLSGLADEFYGQKPAWEYVGEAVTPEMFSGFMQEYCFSFFKLGTPHSYGAFKALSEKMLQYEAGSAVFTDNIGTYYLIAKGDTKTALKYYNKVLKAHPGDLTAIRNCIIIARRDKNVKLEKKYLPMMIQYGDSETDRLAAEARLSALSSKK